MGDWRDGLRGDPLPWLLEPEAPAVRQLALRRLLGRPANDPEVVEAREAAMRTDPIASILAAEDPEGWWVEPTGGYLPKYQATTWQLSFLDQMGADGHDPRVRAACEWVLAHTQTRAGGFGVVAVRKPRLGPPPPSAAIHCLNGNVLRALLGFGWLDDERVSRSIDWQASAILGGDGTRYVGYVTGPGFACAGTAREPCAWGAVKAVEALARVPAERRSPKVRQAIEAGVEFLLSRDPAVADYPTGQQPPTPSGTWFKLGFPLTYVADVLAVLEAVAAAGAGTDPRLTHALAWLLERQDADGRFANAYPSTGKMIVDVDRRGAPSKWVTLRACAVLKAVAEA